MVRQLPANPAPIDSAKPRPTTIGALLEWGAYSLGSTSSTPRLDSELLLCYLLDRPRSYLFAHPENTLANDSLEAFQKLLERRQQGEPIAYLLGYCEFWDLHLEVNSAVLVPRPETEHLVEAALSLLPQAGSLLDLGTGSGAIALGIASSRPDARIRAIDSSAAAVAVARRNCDRLGLEQITIESASWEQGLNGSYAVIVANPPYVEDDAPQWRDSGLHWEPRQALAAGADGLDAIRRLIPAAVTALAPQGWLIVEHGYQQGIAVRQLMSEHDLDEVATRHDLAGLERLTLGRQR